MEGGDQGQSLGKERRDGLQSWSGQNHGDVVTDGGLCGQEGIMQAGTLAQPLRGSWGARRGGVWYLPASEMPSGQWVLDLLLRREGQRRG